MYEELVKRLRSQCQGYGKECEDCNADGNCRSQMENEAADAIEVLSKMEKTTRWIPVTERLPDEKDSVLAITCDCDVYVCDYIPLVKQFWTIPGDELHIDDITHWMPLPDPPKEESNGV